MATIYDVSKLAGVSLATVSRVLNNNVKVNENTRKKVTDAMESLGYRPSSIAQSLASNRTNSVGILVSELHSPFFGEMMGGIEAELRAAGKHVIITTGHNDEDKERDGIEFLISRNCDAIIVHVEAVSNEYLIQLNKGKVPIFIINRLVKGLEENCIHLDNELGGYLAANAIIDNGHKHVAYISGPLSKHDSMERLQGHRRAFNERNIPINEALLFESDFNEDGGREGIKHFIANNNEFTAVICGNDKMASGVMTYAREQHIPLPDKLSIVGFDNFILSRHIFPKLTTIDNPVNEMAHMAAKLVLKKVYQQKEFTIQHHFEPTLITRDSIKNIN